MVIETREEYLRRIGERIGDSAEDIAFLEDMTDTYDNLTALSDSETIARLTAENEELRRKYKERFFTPADASDPDPDPDPEEPEEEEIKTKYEELFAKED